MKKTLLLLLIAILCFGAMTTYAKEAEEVNEIGVYIDEERLIFDDVQPKLIGSRTMVPMRYIFEKFGAVVSYEEETASIMVGYTNVEGAECIMFMMIDNPNVFVNRTAITLDVPPTIVDSRTLVPLRFIGETLGYEVLWDEDTFSVHINTYIPEETEEILGL